MPFDRMSDIATRLRGAGPTISKIMKVSGAASASIGVLHHSEAIHTAGFGFYDIAAQKAPDENTQYQIASLSKAFTGAAVSQLVFDKKVAWNDAIIDILPKYTHDDEAIRTQATLLDFMAQRTCLAQKSALWLQDGSKMLLGREELYPTLAYTEPVHPLGSQWFYSNWGYCVAAEVIENLSGKSWADYLAHNLFRPLGLKNTSTERFGFGENVTKPYQAFLDGSSSFVDPPELVAGQIMQGSSGVTSTVADLLAFYKHFLSTWKHQTETNSTSTPGSPLKDVRMMLQDHIPLDKDSSYSQSYGIGWAVSELPAPLARSERTPCSSPRCLSLEKVPKNKRCGIIMEVWSVFSLPSTFYQIAKQQLLCSPIP